MLSNILHQPSRVITQQVWENVCDPPIQQACIDCLCCASENMVTTLPSWNISSSGTQKGNQQKKSDFNAQRGFKRVPVELRHNGPMAGNLGKTEVDTDTQ